MSGPLQVEFFFSGPPLNANSGASRTDYAGFNLNGVEYKLGDCAYLYPEDESMPPYVGRILACFHDRSGRAADPHCVEVAWYERRAHLESDPYGGNWEREVVALEETDVNPIGCISGKAFVFRAGDYEEASRMAKSVAVDDWLFCRGVFKQCENCFVPLPELAEQVEAVNVRRHGKRTQAGISGHVEGVADSEEVKRQRVAEEQPAAPVRRTGKLVSGRTCVECGATQTPQWREGPAGPKTLCNACGVRYVRAQQRANKRAVPAGAARGGYGAVGRQSRTSKAVKAEMASARAARATAVMSAATAAMASGEEALQRPQRQAALMAASRTAQYARTGFFALDRMDLQLQQQSLDDPNGQIAMHHQHQHESDTCEMMTGAFGMPSAVTAAGATAAGPGTPNCSSYDSCGSLQEGVTVEVVVGAADGEAECCGGSQAAMAAPAAAAAAAVTAIPTYPLLALPPAATAGGTVMSTPAQLGDSSGIMLRVEQSVMAVAPVVALPLGNGQLQSVVPALQTASAVAAVAAAAGILGTASPGFDLGSDTAASGMFFTSGLNCQFSGDGVCYPAQPHHHHDQSGICPQSVPECVAPALSGGQGDAVADYHRTCAVDSCAAQVMSVPVSPSVRGSGAGFGCCSFVDSGMLDDDLHLRGYGGQLDCGLAGGLDDEYTPLVEVEVDFGLGPASAMGDGSLFDGFNNDTCGDDAVVDDDDLQHPQPQPLLGQLHTLPSSQQPEPTLIHELQQHQHEEEEQDGGSEGEEGVMSVADLPAVAAHVAAFCPDLAPGTDARALLDSLPLLAQTALLPHGAGLAANAPPAGDAVAVPAAAAAAPTFPAVAVDPIAAGDGCSVGVVVGVAVSGEDVAHLVALGRQAKCAATEAMAAEAAVQAVNQVLEAQQEVARRAREAAVAKLGRLKNCISTLTGGDPLTTADVGAHFIDLHDLGNGSGLGDMAAAGCCYSFDAADLMVAVHS